MDLEITLYVLEDLNIKSEKLKQDMNSLYERSLTSV